MCVVRMFKVIPNSHIVFNFTPFQPTFLPSLNNGNANKNMSSYPSGFHIYHLRMPFSPPRPQGLPRGGNLYHQITPNPVIALD